jgi:hypothetical protein
MSRGKPAVIGTRPIKGGYRRNAFPVAPLYDSCLSNSFLKWWYHGENLVKFLMIFCQIFTSFDLNR